MFSTTRRTRRSLAAGLTIIGASAVIAATAAAGPLPTGVVVPVPDDKVVQTGPAELVVSRTTSNTVTIANRGRTAAGAFAVTVSDGVYGDQCGGRHHVPGVTIGVKSLAAGRSVTRTVPTDWSATDRIAQADAFNEVAEGNEHNNAGILPGVTIVC